MNNILKQLKTIKLEAILYPPNDVVVTTAEQLAVLESIRDHSTQYLDSRPYQLASITKALQIALDDKLSGTFEKSDMLDALVFMEDEFKALGEVNFIKDSVAFHLSQCKEAAVIGGGNDD